MDNFKMYKGIGCAPSDISSLIYNVIESCKLDINTDCISVITVVTNVDLEYVDNMIIYDNSLFYRAYRVPSVCGFNVYLNKFKYRIKCYILYFVKEFTVMRVIMSL